MIQYQFTSIAYLSGKIAINLPSSLFEMLKIKILKLWKEKVYLYQILAH